MQRWQALFEQVEVIDRGTPQNCTEADLLIFEAQTGIVLPAGYKEFCQVFGSGIFGNYMQVDSPDLNFSRENIGYLKEELRFQAEWDESIDIESIESLLNSAFIFGNNAHSDMLLWDLRTFSESDKSYDIYLAPFSGPAVHLVGRDFAEFIRDFCLGMKAFDLLPEDMQPHIQELHPTFTRF